MSKVQKHDPAHLDEPVTGIPFLPKALPINGAMVSAMIRFGQSYSEGLSLLGQEMLDFSRTRLSRDTATALSMAGCKDWSEASRIQQDWMRTTAEDYVTEMGKLLKLAVKTTVDTCRPLQDQAEAAWGAKSAKE